MSSLTSFTTQLGLDKRTLLALLATPPALYFLSKAAASWFAGPDPSHIHRSPLTSTQTSATSPYPPDCLPGARDIKTPYGSIRAYEWGPAKGRKVLFIHGISTPCIALAGLAQKLVEQHGCRVLLFDLFGRGYSDAPDPVAHPQNAQLWTTQIALVLGSSDLDWWSGCTLLGYSLGGGIAADFASWFPEAVEGLILVAPSGLLRQDKVAWWSRLVYGGFLPRSIVEKVVKKRLQSSTPQQQPPESSVGIVESAEAEAVEETTAPAFSGRPPFSVAETVDWQTEAHPGFVASFISSIQNSPISGQQHRWQLIASRLDWQRSNPNDSIGFREGKVLLLLGDTDGIIAASETSVDAIEALGRENVKVEVLRGGHNLPIDDIESCARRIGSFWDSELVR